MGRGRLREMNRGPLALSVVLLGAAACSITTSTVPPSSTTRLPTTTTTRPSTATPATQPGTATECRIARDGAAFDAMNSLYGGPLGCVTFDNHIVVATYGNTPPATPGDTTTYFGGLLVYSCGSSAAQTLPLPTLSPIGPTISRPSPALSSLPPDSWLSNDPPHCSSTAATRTA